MQIVTSIASWERQSACSTAGQERLLPSLPQCGLLSKRRATCSPWQASSRATAVGRLLSRHQCRELLQLHPLRPPVEVRAAQLQQPPHHSKSGQGRAGGITFQVHMPASSDVIGTKLGIAGPGQPCWSCRKPGHSAGECPLAYGKAGTTLPGWDKKGDKVPAEWSGDEPKRATYKAWVTLFLDARVFPSGQAEVSGVCSAPILDYFMERARNARP